MFEEITVALDGSSEAEIVLPYVIAIGMAFNSRFTLVTAVENASDDNSSDMLDYLKKIAEKLKQRVMGKAVLNISTELITGKPSDAVLKFAAEKKADMVIIAGHGASGSHSRLLGNIAMKILSASNRPVLLIRAERTQERKPEEMIKRILVPLDGSGMSEASLKIVEPVASGLHAEIVLFQAVEPVRYVPGFETMVPNVVLPSDDEIKNAAVQYLKGIEEPLAQKGIKTSSNIITAAPAEAIVDYADSGEIDLIAMTTHGFSGLKRWVFGSVTEKILQAGDKPVLLIPNTNT